MTSPLREIRLARRLGPLTHDLEAFATAGLRRGKRVGCFEYVPSNYRVLYAALCCVPRGRFCEWGSGMGVGVGLAEALGFEAYGIELDPPSAGASRQLLSDFGYTAKIATGSYFDLQHEADVYFTYCWPGQQRRVEEHFLLTAPGTARLLICHGAQDVRCKVKAEFRRDGQPNL